jgi:predicted lysophospholipase L1 biosynthesis ABC-type transport system permease subunit
VGVVENSVVSEIEDKDRPYLYLPYWRERFGEITYLVEPATEAGSFAAPVREALRAVHPSLEPRRVTAMTEFIDFATAPYRATATLALALGALGLALTAIGVYGVVAYLTSRRTREIGVRIALGAAPRGIVALVLNDSIRVAAVGILIGLPAAMWATTLLKPMLLGVAPWDVTAFAVAAAVLSGAVVLAALIPAWRATKVSPAVALRTE